MKSVDKMSAQEASDAFESAACDLDEATVAQIVRDPRKKEGDSTAVAHAKALQRRVIQQTTGVIFSDDPDGMMYHPV